MAQHRAVTQADGTSAHRSCGHRSSPHPPPRAPQQLTTPAAKLNCLPATAYCSTCRHTQFQVAHCSWLLHMQWQRRCDSESPPVALAHHHKVTNYRAPRTYCKCAARCNCWGIPVRCPARVGRVQLARRLRRTTSQLQLCSQGGRAIAGCTLRRGNAATHRHTATHIAVVAFAIIARD